MAISWIRVLRMEGGAIPVRANNSCANGVCAGNCKMSNAWVVFEMEAEGRANQIAENRRERVAPRRCMVVMKGRMCVECWIPTGILGQ